MARLVSAWTADPIHRRILGLWIVIVLVGAAFYLMNEHFLAQGNLVDLIRASSSLAVVALGETLVLVSGELDLSVGSTYALSSIVVATLWIDHGISVYLAVLIGLVVGGLVGLVNGLVTVVGRIPSFVVTLGTLTLVAGVALVVSNGQYFVPAGNIPPLPANELDFFAAIGSSTPFGVPSQILWLAASAFIVFVVLHRSAFGFRLMAVGGNPTAARFARLPVRKYRTLVFVACGVLAALAGIIDFSFLGAVQPASSGAGLTFPVFAAVIIGGASLSGGSGTVLGTLTGALLLQVLANGLALVGAGGGAQQIFTGFVTIVAVGLDQWLRPRTWQLGRRAA